MSVLRDTNLNLTSLPHPSNTGWIEFLVLLTNEWFCAINNGHAILNTQNLRKEK